MEIQQNDPRGIAENAAADGPCSFKIEDIQSTWKLNQNKTDMSRLAAADAVAQTGVGSETIALAALMRAAEGSNHGHD